MSPGPELDKAVAKALGLTIYKTKWPTEERATACAISRSDRHAEASPPIGSWAITVCSFAPSTDCNDAMWAAEQAGLFDSTVSQFHKAQFLDHATVLLKDNNRWLVTEYGLVAPHEMGIEYEHPLAEAPTVPHAICLAILALKAQP